jgi:Kef-type K+ transport system membrane component KefB
MNILWILVRMLLFLGAASIIGWWSFPKLNRRIDLLPISQGIVSFSIVAILLYGWLAESMGNMAAITGAFLAGLWFSQTEEKERIHNGIATIAYGFFVPIFFINIGLSANARALNWESGLLLLVMVAVAVLSKIIGAGLGGILGGFSHLEALQLGVGMMSRGEVGLIVAAIGIEQGLIEESTFSVVVGVVILTTLLTPPSLRVLFSGEKKKPPNLSVSTEGEAK